MWHSTHVTGAHAVIATLGALMEREQSGHGQHIDVSVHRSVNFDTGSDIPFWVFEHKHVHRQTAQYASPTPLRNNLLRTRDDRFILNYLYQPRHYVALLKLLRDEGRDVLSETTSPDGDLSPEDLTPAIRERIERAAEEWVAGQNFRDDIWQLAHRHRLNWAPVREPSEALRDPYWRERGALSEIHHEDLGRSLTYPARPWIASQAPWVTGIRAPHLGEHNELMSAMLDTPANASAEGETHPPQVGEPFTPLPNAGLVRPLEGVRILDLTRIVAGSGATRLLAAFGAETIKIEWHENPDFLRSRGAVIPLGADAARVRAGEHLKAERSTTDQSGPFAEMNCGKLGVSLNLKTERGRGLFHRLVEISDVVVENLAPGALERLGLGYADLVRDNPQLVYAQLSGFGQDGSYSHFISTAPVAEAFTGLTALSGLPEPNPPAGWGYPYLDVASSYYLAMAIIAALFYRKKTGKGQQLDCSLADTGLYLTGTALIDRQVNGSRPVRFGNRSIVKPSAPHGIFPCRGEDRWIALSVTTESEWDALLTVLGDKDLAADPRFKTMDDRINHESELELEVSGLTRVWDEYQLMTSLQQAGVIAGVCQTSADRVDRDAQLRYDNIFAYLNTPTAGIWPVREIPWKSSGAGAHVGGSLGRGFPSYGEDNDYVFGRLLGLGEDDINQLSKDGVI
jgi:crotonobetainyl-CoA:carnitine CoA-transferase CaiB-like acyl-CoA transferase